MQPDVSELCDQIRAEYRDRLFAMRMRIRTEGALGAYVRGSLGWSLDKPQAVRTKIERTTKALIDYGAKVLAEKPATDEPDDWDVFARQILLSLQSAKPWAQEEEACKSRAAKLAKALPIWTFAEGIRGFGANGLATIIGEAGDLSVYDRESKLWKRMGVGVIGPGDGLHDHRQGNPGKNATKADWTVEGYNRFRRSRLYGAVAEPLLKAQGPYREIYLHRKAYEIARAEALGLTVAPGAKIPKKDAVHYRSAMHVHRRAHRYMEKRLLRHLWRAWHRKTAIRALPPQARMTLPAFDANTTGGGQHPPARMGHFYGAASDLIQPLGEAAT